MVTMSLFNRKSKKSNINPTTHIALLHISNEHHKIEETYDLSHFSYDELCDIVGFIEFKSTLQDVEDAEDFKLAHEMYTNPEEYDLEHGDEDE